ncbi:hypothetical protein FOL47_004806 [Perkinsus chesapeaki]|uniref:N-acetyltransferase domain-containing protein n=1 Tax=Perkinsus chesapeaki TaxID=330153 RepID=A0A7J6M0P0_PERCH|nr:hypothetical protein FOL47_004806 [Perkinsus chesapeaki]
MKGHKPLLVFAVFCPVTLALGSHHHPESSFISTLDYRPATEEDMMGLHRELEGTDFFVAVKRNRTPGEIAVGSVEFGVVVIPQYGEWLYIAHVDTRSDCRGKGVAPQLLRKLLGYVHKKKPDIIGAWMRVQCSNRSAMSAYFEAGFANAGIEEGQFCNFVYTFGPEDDSEHFPDDGRRPLPYLGSITMRFLFAELIKLKVVEPIISM